jgi:hypothetical protein
MTGPEHYREAERLLAMQDVADKLPHADIAMIQQQAQVHATLALAAATALNDYPEGAPLADLLAWRTAAATPADSA